MLSIVREVNAVTVAKPKLVLNWCHAEDAAKRALSKAAIRMILNDIDIDTAIRLVAAIDFAFLEIEVIEED